MRSVESKAKTMEEAVTLGLEKLGVSFADVKIDIISEGSKGFLGLLGAKPVVVRLTVREDVEAAEAASAKPAAAKGTAKGGVKQKDEKAKQKVQEKVAEPAKPKHREAKKTPVAPADGISLESKAEDFLKEVTRLMGVDVTIATKQDEEGNIRVDMHGDTLGILIGRRGETLDALQYLTSLYVNRGQEGYTRVTLDTENYRAKREEALTRLANRMANRAVKTGRKVVMEPMNPYERRILHSALQKNDAVATHSEGEEPNRHVVITVK